MIKALFTKTKSCVNVNGHLNDWFYSEIVVWQGDSLPLTLFSIFINDLIAELKVCYKDIKIANQTVPALFLILMIIILLKDSINHQIILDKVNGWCENWKNEK